MQTLVLGIGNTLLRDEGAGIHALNTLMGHYFSSSGSSATQNDADVLLKLPKGGGVRFIDGGTLSFTLAGLLEQADNLVVIDAAQLGKPPGSVDCFMNTGMDRFLGACKRSVHEVGLLDLLDMARLTGHLPEQRALVGIQPEVIDWGDNLSEAVAIGLTDAVNAVNQVLSSWHDELGSVRLPLNADESSLPSNTANQSVEFDNRAVDSQ